MLYVLEDPALDRDSFEARLADDVRLGEILAIAVEMLHAMRSTDPESLAPVYFDVPTVRTFTESPTGSIASESVPYSWLGLVSLAASILLVGFLGWKSFQAFAPSMVGTERGSSANRSLSQTNGDTELFKNVVWAWGEVRNGQHEPLLAQYISMTEGDVALASCDSVCENDVPEWLVLATATILEQGGGVDLPLDDLDSRTLIQ